MTFIDMRGGSADLDAVLMRCLKSGMFQPEYASKLSEYSIGSSALLRNPYGGLLVKVKEIAASLKIPLAPPDATFGEAAIGVSFIEETHNTLDHIRREYPKYFEKRDKINDELVSYTVAADMLSHMDSPDLENVNFDELWENKYLKIRFGRIPTVNVPKLSAIDSRLCEIFTLDENPVMTWLMYFTAHEFKNEVDPTFTGLGFERLRIPDYVHGTAGSAAKFLMDGIAHERALLEDAGRELERFIASEKDLLLSLYARIAFLHEAYDLRKYVVSIREQFHLVGFVLKRDKDSFKAMFADIASVELEATPAGHDSRVTPPVKLKNNWFVRPFEMFVNMYGSPGYNDIDPSPFVAYTYSILFGVMFGDLGQGFCVSFLGFILFKWKGMQLGEIMSRIGVSSMIFGTAYGSVFGFEHALDWFYVGVLGLREKPVEVMRPDTTNIIMMAAIGIGIVIIFMVIIFNMAIGIKHRDFDRAVLSHNGLAGLVLYGAGFLMIFDYITHINYLSQRAEMFLIVIPLVVVFFREPLTHLIKYKSTADILKDKPLAAVKTFQEGSINIQELFTSQYVLARFGRMPTDSYRKLHFYEAEPFMLYPVKSSVDYIWCIYAMAYINEGEIDAIFHDLQFERIFIPNEYLKSNESAESYIKRCVAAGGIPEDEGAEDKTKYGELEAAKPKTAMETMFPEGFGSFLTQTFFELFEVCLSFITNTMSFLRVGGFILVHAGMMTVVFTLAEMVGGGALPVVIVIGNLFVMALEGLIVGIQVLRLEFYEIFSRFFDATGEPFKPVKFN